MEIIHLTPENADALAYPCVIHGTRQMRRSRPYRNVSITFLQKTINTRIKGIAAVEDGRAVGHLFYGTLKGSGLPVRCSESDIPAVFCTFVNRKYSRMGVGKAMIEAAIRGCKDESGLLVLATRQKTYMPMTLFSRLGFQKIHEDGFWNIGYYPITRASVDVETYVPELEWDYVKPFTFVIRNLCPFLIRLREDQKRTASHFHDLLPIDEVPFEEAVRRDENVTPGFYLFGKEVPISLMAGWKLKRYIKKSIQDESLKTFGMTAPTRFEKRK